MLFESEQINVNIEPSEVEFIVVNKKAGMHMVVTRNHVISLKNLKGDIIILCDWSKEPYTVIKCEAIGIAPRENLVIIPPPQGPAGIMIPPNLRHR